MTSNDLLLAYTHAPPDKAIKMQPKPGAALLL